MSQQLVQIEFTLNGKVQSAEFPAHLTALRVLRDQLGLMGTKEGCGIGECGACTIEVDGKAINSCLMLGAQLDGRNVLTVEGLSDCGTLHDLQEKFIDNHGVQCGFCTPGLLMSTHALLEENKTPDKSEITKAVAGNLCRCTGYQQIITSIEKAVDGAGGVTATEGGA